MAHIPDGILSAPVLIVGAMVALGGCAQGLRRLESARIPEVALLSAAFFVASLVRFPLGPTSVHLILTGLTGIMLGWAAFPAILGALLLQAVFFGFGGLVVLGVNTMNMALPAVVCGMLFRFLFQCWKEHPQRLVWSAGFCGGLGVALTALAIALSLAASGRAFLPAAWMALASHVPVMGIEAVFTGAAVGLLVRAKPEFFRRS
jgi:cobalt/nickel transport system permease protein